MNFAVVWEDIFGLPRSNGCFPTKYVVVWFASVCLALEHGEILGLRGCH